MNYRAGTRLLTTAVCCLFTILLSVSLVSAQTLYSTGFESPAYRTGGLVGQDGWDVEGVAGAVTIQTTIVRTGSQAVRINAAQNPDALSYYFRSVGYNTGGNKVIEVNWDMYIQSASEPSVYFGVECYDSNINLIGGMAVDALTRFVNVSDGDTLRDVNTLVTKDAWNSFRLRFDYSTRTYSAYVNGALAADGLQFGPLANNTFGEVDLFSDNRLNPPGNDSAYFDNVQAAVAQPAAAISGVVTLESAGIINGTPITFQFRPTDGTATFTRTINLSADGSFHISDLPLKNYTVHVKGAKWLAKNVAVNATTGDVTNVNVTLKAGDATNDNTVDILDLDLLLGVFDTANGNPAFDVAADFNDDGFVDILDLDLLLGNFDQTGDA